MNNTNERDKLERLCRYVTRPTLSNKRLSLTRNGQLRHEVKNTLAQWHHARYF
jgi:hypothetical protein